MIASVSPGASELITTSRSDTTITSAIAVLTIETRVTVVSARIGNDLPIGRSSGLMGAACALATVENAPATRQVSPAWHKTSKAHRSTPFLTARKVFIGRA